MTDAGRIIRLRRALTLGDKLWRLEKNRLLQMDAELSRLTRAEEDVLKALARGAYDPRLAVSRLAALTPARCAALEAREAQLRRANAFGRRTKLLERLAERAEADWRRERAVAGLRRLGGASKASPT